MTTQLVLDALEQAIWTRQREGHDLTGLVHHSDRGAQAGYTQAELAERIGVGQRQVSKIENGDIENAKVGTIRGYLEAVGGGMALEYVIGGHRVQVA